MPRAIGRGPTNLLSRTKAPRVRGCTPTCIARKGDQGNAAYWLQSGRKVCLPTTTRCGMAQHRKRIAGIERAPRPELQAPIAASCVGCWAHGTGFRSRQTHHVLLRRAPPSPPSFSLVLSCIVFLGVFGAILEPEMSRPSTKVPIGREPR